MDIKYILMWGFAYKEISGECGESDWRRIDFQKNDPLFTTGNLVVFMDFDFPERKEGDPPKKPKYSGKYVVRKIKQTVRNHPGVTKGYVGLLLTEVEHIPDQIPIEISKIIGKYEEEDGPIPLP